MERRGIPFLDDACCCGIGNAVGQRSPIVQKFILGRAPICIRLTVLICIILPVFFCIIVNTVSDRSVLADGAEHLFILEIALLIFERFTHHIDIFVTVRAVFGQILKCDFLTVYSLAVYCDCSVRIDGTAHLLAVGILNERRAGKVLIGEITPKIERAAGTTFRINVFVQPNL